MITKNDRPACREAERSHQHWVTWLPPTHCTCWKRHYFSCILRLRRVGWSLRIRSMVWRLLQAWVLSLSACLAWPGQLGPTQTRLSWCPALLLELLIKLTFDPLEFLNRSPFESLLTLPVFFHFVLNGESGFHSDALFCEPCIAIYVLSTLSTRIIVQRFNHFKLLL